MSDKIASITIKTIPLTEEYAKYKDTHMSIRVCVSNGNGTKCGDWLVERDAIPLYYAMEMAIPDLWEKLQDEQ